MVSVVWTSSQIPGRKQLTLKGQTIRRENPFPQSRGGRSLSGRLHFLSTGVSGLTRWAPGGPMEPCAESLWQCPLDFFRDTLDYIMSLRREFRTSASEVSISRHNSSFTQRVEKRMESEIVFMFWGVSFNRCVEYVDCSRISHERKCVWGIYTGLCLWDGPEVITRTPFIFNTIP